MTFPCTNCGNHKSALFSMYCSENTYPVLKDGQLFCASQDKLREE